MSTKERKLIIRYIRSWPEQENPSPRQIAAAIEDGEHLRWHPRRWHNQQPEITAGA